MLHAIDNTYGSDYFTVRWDASEGAEHYELEHSFAGAAPLIHNVVDTELLIGDAPVGQHVFRVRAVNGAGHGTYSTAVDTEVLEPDLDDSEATYYPQAQAPYPLDESGGHWVSPLLFDLDPSDLVFTTEGQYRAARFIILPADKPATISIPVPEGLYAIQGMLRPTAGSIEASVFMDGRRIVDITGVEQGVKWYGFTAYAAAPGEPCKIEIYGVSEDNEHVLFDIAGIMIFKALSG